MKGRCEERKRDVCQRFLRVPTFVFSKLSFFFSLFFSVSPRQTSAQITNVTNSKFKVRIARYPPVGESNPTSEKSYKLNESRALARRITLIVKPNHQVTALIRCEEKVL